MTTQIAAALTRASLPDERADWLIERLNAERDQGATLMKEAKRRVQKEIEKIDTKLDRLTAAYLDAGAFTAPEFRSRKAEGLNTKRKLLDDIAALDQDETKRFEPIIRFGIPGTATYFAWLLHSPREVCDAAAEFLGAIRSRLLDRKIPKCEGHWHETEES